MRVRFFGFDLTVGAISLEDFVEHLKTTEGIESPHWGDSRLLYVGERDKYYLGLLLTAKEHRRFCELAKIEAGFKVQVRQLKDQNRFVFFNFFVINKNTSRGLFQHYRGSCGLLAFGSFMRKQYNVIREDRRSKEIKAAEDAGAKTKAIKDIRSKYKETLSCSPLFKKSDFETLLKNMKRIDCLSMDFATITAHEPRFLPASGLVKKEKHVFTFADTASKLAVAKWIGTTVKEDEEGEFGNVSVGGLDVTGEPVTYHILKNVETFANYDFDEITENSIFDLNSVSDSPMFDKMLDAVDAHRTFFEQSSK